METTVAMANTATVVRRSRSGVNHAQPRFCSQARTPLAPAIAVIAHPAHMATMLPRRYP